MLRDDDKILQTSPLMSKQNEKIYFLAESFIPSR